MFAHISDSILWRQGGSKLETPRDLTKMYRRHSTRKSNSTFRTSVPSDVDDPLTQVSRLRFPEESEPKFPGSRRLSTRDASTGALSTRRISSTLLRFSSPTVMSSQDESQQPDASEREEQEGAEEDIAEEEEVHEAPVVHFEPKVKSTFGKADVVAFCDDIKRKTHREELPPCARFARRNACRFGLPPDMRTLEGLTPMTYIMKYMSVDQMKQEMYKKAYKKTCKANLEQVLSPQYLSHAFLEAFHRNVQEPHMKTLRDLTQFDEENPLDEKTFIRLTGMLERILSTENKDTILEPLDVKDDIEIADFAALALKLEGISLSLEMQNLLNYIKNS